MKWIITGIFMVLLMMVLHTQTGRADTVNQPTAPIVSIQAGTDIDAFTTTRYDTPWWVQYHMTPPEQVAIEYKGGEASQMIYALAVSPTNPQHLLLGTDTSGIWKSEDGGAVWKVSSDGFGLMGTMDIAFDPDNENIAYVAASPNAASNPLMESARAGIWKSVDGGASWNQILATSFYRKTSNKLIRFGEVESNGNRAIYVASHSKGIFKSIDGGQNWTNIGLVGETIDDLFVDNTHSRILAATETKGVMVSTDDGISWAAQNTGFSTLKALSITANPSNLNHWFAVADGKVYDSTNAGDTWTDLQVSTQDITPGGKFSKLIFGAPDTNGNARLYLSIYSSQYSIRYTTDLGTTWNKPAVQNETAFIKDNWGWFSEAFAVHPTDPNVLWVPLDNEIYKSKDGGGSLYPSSSGFSGLRASGFLFDNNDNNNIYITAIDRGLVKSVDYGAGEKYPMFEYLMDDRYNPRYMGQKTVHAIARDPQDPQHLFIVIGDWGPNTIISESHDGGLNFTPIAGTENGGARIIKYHPQNSSIIYAGKYKSMDGGLNWSTLTKTVGAVSPLNGDVVWSATGAVISKSTDGGLTWTTVVTTISGIQNLVPDLFVADRLWIGSFASGLYRLDGSTLTNINVTNGLVRSLGGSLPIFDIAQDPKNQLHMVAGGTDNQGLTPSAGLFETLNGGQTWRVVEGLPGTRDIWKVAFHPNLPRVYVGTSSGTWVYEFDKYYDRNLLSDNFEDGDSAGWTPGLGSWSVTTEGPKVLNITTIDGVVKTGNTSWNDYTVQSKIKMTGQYYGTGSGITFRYNDANNMYWFRLSKDDNQLKLLKKQAGNWTVISSVPQSLSFNTWYTAKVVVNGTSIICYLDGVEKINITDTTFANGSIGFRSYNTSSLYDDVVVTDNSGQILLSDNFEDGNSAGWTTVLGIPWTVIIDDPNNVFNMSSTTGEALAFAGNTSWNNYTIQSRFKMTGEGAGSSGSGIVFRYQDSNNMYSFQLNRAGNQ